MTTTQSIAGTIVSRAIKLPTLAAFCALALAGCESGASIFGASSSEPETQITQAAPPPPVIAQPRIALAPVIGAPDGVAKQMFQDMTTAVGSQKATVVGATDKAEHTLRGYVVAAKDRVGVKVSYIWDVTDPQGRRTNRITGEEIISNGNGKDPWSAVSPQISQTIAQKSAASFGAWLSTQQPSAAPAVASATPATLVSPSASAIGAAPQAVAAATTPTATAVATKSIAAAAQEVPTTPTTASIDRPASIATPSGTMVTALSGAPGDGNTALATALKTELGKSGVTMSNNPTSAHRVEGVVAVGSPSNGNQSVQIDWIVKDPQGKRLGTVTQKNEIPQGSLDGSWGKTAEAAAQAAAQGILKLLPKAGATTAQN
ncbi:MAG: hypothetical protein ABL898_06230 [Hyphomicrobiaceae bacterium]|nr:hypothetical protein [Hyphomicrobiaceae bacterium]